MFDEKLWKVAQKKAKKEYEEECGCWEEADKYEREDWVFSRYIQLKESTNDELLNDLRMEQEEQM